MCSQLGKKHMPYESGEEPKKGDHVRNHFGRTGVITHVARNQANLRGEDAIGVKWDDGGVGVGMALAREFVFISRGDS